MISTAALAALIAFTPVDESHPEEVCQLMGDYAHEAFLHPNLNQPEGDELTHIFKVVTQRKKDLGFTSDGVILSSARMYRYEFYNACMRDEI